MTRVAVRLETHGDQFEWVLSVPCPYCGSEHRHGGGPLDGDPRQFLGERLAHCESWDARGRRRRIVKGDYVLVCMEPAGVAA